MRRSPFLMSCAGAVLVGASALGAALWVLTGEEVSTAPALPDQPTLTLDGEVYAAAAVDRLGEGAFALLLGGGPGTPDRLVDLHEGAFRVLQSLEKTAATRAAIAVDWDGDGWQDLLVGRGDGLVWLRNEQGVFRAHSLTLPAAVRPWPLAAGDLDGDGDLDLFAGDRILFQTEAGLIDEVLPGLGSHLAVEARIADLDLDGWLDVLIAPESGPPLAWSNLQNTFTRVSLHRSSGAWGGLALGDVDSDGDLDLVLSNSGATAPPQVSGAGTSAWLLLRNAGGMVFDAEVLGAGLAAGAGLVLSDVDDDGTLDLLAAQATSWRWARLRPAGGKRLLQGAEWADAGGGVPGARGVLAVDLNGDGRNDHLWWGAQSVLQIRLPGPSVAVITPHDGRRLGMRITLRRSDGTVFLAAPLTGEPGLVELPLGTTTAERVLFEPQGELPLIVEAPVDPVLVLD